MKLIRKTTWRDNREENRGEERAALLASNGVYRCADLPMISIGQGNSFAYYWLIEEV
jgi:hypothetical protein